MQDHQGQPSRLDLLLEGGPPPLHSALIYDTHQHQWCFFQEPVEVMTTATVVEVLPLLHQVQKKVETDHCYAVGFVSYEAAPAFDPHFQVMPAGNFPLAWFALYPSPQLVRLPPVKPSPSSLLWSPSISPQEYEAAFRRIKDYISQGLTYQVNYSFRLRTQLRQDPWTFFLQMNQAQAGKYGAYLQLEEWSICCASPELFFHLRKDQISCRPMKGTIGRGLGSSQDFLLQQKLRNSQKDQAENLMIVDMIRNDLGQISKVGSIRVNPLFQVERYPTLWQMTSTIQSTTDENWIKVLQALFPCASITGAPKISTMRIISQLESDPRKIYTGTIGLITPEQNCQFNVAIRTVLYDKKLGIAEYGVGGGIVWDSQVSDEYGECHVKAQVLTHESPDFSLLETLLWSPEEGFFLLDLHLQRLKSSAEYFSIPLSLNAVIDILQREVDEFADLSQKVRILVTKQAQIEIEKSILSPQNRAILNPVCLHHDPVNSRDVFLYHKTTNRGIYRQAQQCYPEYADVLLWNEKGELTEFCNANLVIQLQGSWYTPPVTCGLLPGTYRTWLMQQGQLQERVLRLESLQHAERVFSINSVRKMQEVQVDFSSKSRHNIAS
jgi:para-aminobenzoate synthetase/4-amino-4-deoxychorismate lyase